MDGVSLGIDGWCKFTDGVSLGIKWCKFTDGVSLGISLWSLSFIISSLILAYKIPRTPVLYLVTQCCLSIIDLRPKT